MNFFDIPLELSAQHRQHLLEFEIAHDTFYYAEHMYRGEKFPLNLLLESTSIEDDNVDDGANPAILQINPRGSFQTPDCIHKVLEMFSYQPVRWSFAKINKKDIIPTHMDGQDSKKRNTVIIFPLQPYNEHYAPCDIMRFPNSKKPLESITFRPCYAFSTECWHRVKNNKYCRKSLQLWYADHIETLYEKFQQGQLLKKD